MGGCGKQTVKEKQYIMKQPFVLFGCPHQEKVLQVPFLTLLGNKHNLEKKSRRYRFFAHENALKSVFARVLPMRPMPRPLSP